MTGATNGGPWRTRWRVARSPARGPGRSTPRRSAPRGGVRQPSDASRLGWTYTSTLPRVLVAAARSPSSTRTLIALRSGRPRPSATSRARPARCRRGSIRHTTAGVDAGRLQERGERAADGGPRRRADASGRPRHDEDELGAVGIEAHLDLDGAHGSGVRRPLLHDGDAGSPRRTARLPRGASERLERPPDEDGHVDPVIDRASTVLGQRYAAGSAGSRGTGGPGGPRPQLRRRGPRREDGFRGAGRRRTGDGGHAPTLRSRTVAAVGDLRPPPCGTRSLAAALEMSRVMA